MFDFMLVTKIVRKKMKKNVGFNEWRKQFRFSKLGTIILLPVKGLSNKPPLPPTTYLAKNDLAAPIIVHGVAVFFKHI